MPKRLLVLHGPNVPLALEQEAGLSLTALHRALNAVAKEAGVTLRFAHVHGEEGVVGELWTQRRGLGGVLWVSLAKRATADADAALTLLDVPVEQLIDASPTRDAYEAALVALIEQVQSGAKAPRGQKVAGATTSAGRTKSIGRTRASETASSAVDDADADAPQSGVKKTLGRRRETPATSAKAGPPRTLGRAAGSRSRGQVEASHPTQTPRAGLSGVPTRAQTRVHIAQRLSGALSAAALSTWAQEGWAKAEAAQVPDTKLSAVLLSLMAGQRLSDDRLVSLMSELDT